MLRDLAESHKHVVSGDANLVEGGPAIVFRLIADFGAEVTTFDTGTNFPGFNISDLDHKWLHSIIILANDCTGKDESMARKSAEIARPVLGRSDRWSVNHELVRDQVESRSGFDSCHI